MTERSSAPAPHPRTIVVSGDVSVDWLLPSSAGERRAPVDFIWMWGGAYSCRAISSRGGAAAHARILRAAADAAGLTHVTVAGPDVPPEALASPYHASCSCTYALIQRVPRELGVDGPAVWRIADFLGMDPAPQLRPAVTPPAVPGTHRHPAARRPRAGLPRPAGGAAGPARRPARSTSCGRPERRTRARPSPTCLLGEHADVLTVITASDELRKSGHQVGYASRGSSSPRRSAPPWPRTPSPRRSA